jgi:Zn finger protein HypA/HybF involved in hydrogenase expression
VEILEEEDEGESEGEEEEGFAEPEYPEGESAAEEEESTEEVECPECHETFTLDLAGYTSGTVNCPNCGAELELSFEKDEGEQEE